MTPVIVMKVVMVIGILRTRLGVIILGSQGRTDIIVLLLVTIAGHIGGRYISY